MPCNWQEFMVNTLVYWSGRPIGMRRRAVLGLQVQAALLVGALLAFLALASVRALQFDRARAALSFGSQSNVVVTRAHAHPVRHATAIKKLKPVVLRGDYRTEFALPPIYPYSRLIRRVAIRYGLPPDLVAGVVQTESQFDPRCLSPVGAEGLMQLMPSTAERFGVLDPFDPRQNILGGVKYLKWLHDYYQGDLTKVVAAYNAGEGAVNRHHGIPPYRETRAYVPKVLDLYRRKAVQPDPKLAGSMALLQKGRGGFKVDEQKTVPEPTVQQRASTRIYQWMDAHGRLQISDQPPPKGTPGVKTFGDP